MYPFPASDSSKHSLRDGIPCQHPKDHLEAVVLMDGEICHDV